MMWTKEQIDAERKDTQIRNKNIHLNIPAGGLPKDKFLKLISSVIETEEEIKTDKGVTRKYLSYGYGLYIFFSKKETDAIVIERLNRMEAKRLKDEQDKALTEERKQVRKQKSMATKREKLIKLYLELQDDTESMRKLEEVANGHTGGT